MTRDEVISRLCQLASEVGKHFEYRHAADCFCIEGVYQRSVSTFQFEQSVMDFIVNAVEDKINESSKSQTS